MAAASSPVPRPSGACARRPTFTRRSAVRSRPCADDVRTGFGATPGEQLAGQLTGRQERIVRLGGCETVAVELLASYQDPMLALSQPLAVRLRNLELHGQIGEVTDRMVALAAQAAPGAERIHVNFSASDLADADLPGRIEASWTFPSGCKLVVETTEHLPVVDSFRLRQNLAWLRQRDIPIAVDDYGHGYSDAWTVRTLGASIGKFSAVGQARDGVWPDAFLGHLRRVANELAALDVVPLIEGIETAVQHSQALDCGFVLGQGRLFL